MFGKFSFLIKFALFLVYMVTEHMHKNLTLAEFLLKVRTHPLALSLIIKVRKIRGYLFVNV